jgi:hypothetical protein
MNMVMPIREQLHCSVHFKSGALAFLVAIAEAIVEGLRSPFRFSAAEFVFAFILTYAIAFSTFSENRQP